MVSETSLKTRCAPFEIIESNGLSKFVRIFGPIYFNPILSRGIKYYPFMNYPRE